MTEEITVQQTADERTSAVQSGQRADTGGARSGAERRAGQINRYLYENLVSNVEGQIECWNRRASRESDPQAAEVLRHKAEGLGYALRLLNAFQPEFHELVAKAENRKCQGCGGELDKLNNLDMQRQSAFYRVLRAWAVRLRAKKAAPKVSRDERRKAELLRKITTAERKADHLRVHYRPYNPTLEWGEKAGDYEREQWAAWIAQKPMRRRIGRLATAHGLHQGYVPQAVINNPRKLYERLAALTGHSVNKYGQLHNTSRHEKPIGAEYLKHLYEYAGNTFGSKPYRSREWRTPEHIGKDQLDYCQRMRDWRNAQETVNWLRAQLMSFDGSKDNGDDLR